MPVGQALPGGLHGRRSGMGDGALTYGLGRWLPRPGEGHQLAEHVDPKIDPVACPSEIGTLKRVAAGGSDHDIRHVQLWMIDTYAQGAGVLRSAVWQLRGNEFRRPSGRIIGWLRRRLRR